MTVRKIAPLSTKLFTKSQDEFKNGLFVAHSGKKIQNVYFIWTNQLIDTI